MDETELARWLQGETARINIEFKAKLDACPTLLRGTGEQKQTPSKFDGFVFALRALCIAHGVHLSTTMYDGLEVWDSIEGEPPLTTSGIEDCTKRRA